MTRGNTSAAPVALFSGAVGKGRSGLKSDLIIYCSCSVNLIIQAVEIAHQSVKKERKYSCYATFIAI